MTPRSDCLVDAKSLSIVAVNASPSELRQTPNFKLSTVASLLKQSLKQQMIVGLGALSVFSSVATAQSFPAEIELSELDGTNGFMMRGGSSEITTGTWVSNAGDVNGDGFDDLILGFPETFGASELRASVVVFGSSTVGNSGEVDVATLDGTDGFAVIQVQARDDAGRAVSGGGDVNGDGFSDFVIGAPRRGGSFIGESYVVFGGQSVGIDGTFNLSELNGSNGFVIDGFSSFFSGYSLSSSADVNGDGFDDVVVGTGSPRYGGQGRSYVVFGGSNVGTAGAVDVSSLDGSDGFLLSGEASSSFSADVGGDFNNDGASDIILGQSSAAPNGRSSAGVSHVIFGGANVGSTGEIDLLSLDGIVGFVLNGVDAGDMSGESVSNAGDFNGDGVSDLIIGAYRADGVGTDNNGESYVVFGGGGLGATGAFELSNLDGTNGIVIHGVDAGDNSGISVSEAGDVNSDGLSDIIIGASNATANGNASSGKSYVVFGNSNPPASLDLSSLDGTNGFVINGERRFSGLGHFVSSAGDVNGDGYTDILIGSEFGESYVIFGKPPPPMCGDLAVTVQIGLGEVPTSGDDVILGTDGDDIIDSLSGNDTICALGGDDQINAGNGNNVINAGPGDDTVTTLEGADTIFAGDGADNVNSGAGNDLVIGNEGADTLSSGAGDDVVNGGGGNDVIVAGAGDDSIFGLGGMDNIQGGEGTDLIVAGAGDDIVFGNEGNDEINGGPGSDTLNGGDGDDSLFGQAGDDLLLGGAGDDFVIGVEGVDEINGGTGNDILNGGPGDDTINGGEGMDVLFGLAGDDTLNGGASNDRIFGQLGSDVIEGGAGDDQLWGNQDNDVITAQSGSNVINGGGGDDTITGGSGDDVIFGDGNTDQAGADIINGGPGEDELLGFAGDDQITAADGEQDLVNGGPGTDICDTDAIDVTFKCP